MKDRIVFFGGTFDPPHKEHINIAKSASKYYSPDRFIVMPTAIPPHKDVFFSASANDRLNMCKIAFSEIEKLEVSDMEVKGGGKSYSYITIRKLKEKYPEADIIFLMGSDMLRTFSEWKNPDDILKNCRLSLCEREGDESAEKTVSDFKEKYGMTVDVINYVGKNLSSTEYKISRMLGIKSDFVIKEVEDYIDLSGLYLPNEYFKFVKDNLTEKRLIHTKGVILSAIKISKKLGVDLYKTITSAVLHDSAKYLDYRNYKDFVLPNGVPDSVIHQFLGAYVAEKILGVKDEEVLEAIKYHTSGKVGMGLLAKIIYVADMIEDGREYDGVERLREVTYKNFDEGFKLCLKRTADHLRESGKPIYEETLKAEQYYLKGEK